MNTRITITVIPLENALLLARIRRSSTCVCAKAGCAITAQPNTAPNLARRCRRSSPRALQGLAFGPEELRLQHDHQEVVDTLAQNVIDVNRAHCKFVELLEIAWLRFEGMKVASQ